MFSQDISCLCQGLRDGHVSDLCLVSRTGKDRLSSVLVLQSQQFPSGRGIMSAYTMIRFGP